MFQKYLDPHVTMYEEIEWNNEEGLSRILSLNRFLGDVRTYENQVGKPRELFKFQASSDMVTKLYEYRPFRNDPPERPFYRTIFTQKIWPDLVRRLFECPAKNCGAAVGGADTVPHPYVAESEVDELFVELLSVCATCSRKPRALFVHKSRRAVRDPAPFFEMIFDIDVSEGQQVELETAVSWLELWPAPTDTRNRERGLSAAVKCLKAHCTRDDPTWQDYQIGKYNFTDRFWRALSRAEFGGNADNYPYSHFGVLAANFHRA